MSMRCMGTQFRLHLWNFNMASPQSCPTSDSKEKYVGEDSLFEEFFLLSKGKGLKEQSDENVNVIRCDHVSLSYNYQLTIFLTATCMMQGEADDEMLQGPLASWELLWFPFLWCQNRFSSKQASNCGKPIQFLWVKIPIFWMVPLPFHTGAQEREWGNHS